MEQHRDTRRGHVSPAAVLGIVAVTLLGGLLVLANLVLALASSIGPDSCEQAVCHGDGTRAVVFVGLAVVSGVASMGTWFTARSTRRTARYVLALIAIGVPVAGDLVALAGAPDWLV